MESTPLSQRITRWLDDWRQGDAAARDRLFAVVQPQLQQIAARFLHHERADHTLEPNALVDELCLRMPSTPNARKHPDVTATRMRNSATRRRLHRLAVHSPTSVTLNGAVSWQSSELIALSRRSEEIRGEN